MALRIPSPVALTKPEAYLAYKAGILSRGELKDKLLNPINNYEGWLAKWCELLETYPTNEDGTPQCLTDEEGLLAYLCGVTNRYPASNSNPDDARVSAYIRYLVSARYARPDHPLNREEFYLSLIKTQFIPSGDPSSDIVIDGTTKAPFLDVKMYGDSYQQTYSGKNLWDGEFGQGQVSTSSAIRITSTQSPLLESGTTYTVSLSSVPAGMRYAVALYNNPAYPESHPGAAVYDSGWQTDTSYTFTVAGDYYFSVVMSKTDSSNITPSDVANVNFQLEKSSSASSYEPYVGGTPAPNPSYPQPISVVTGGQTVKVVGKNLFHFTESRAVTSDGVTLETTEGTSVLKINGTSTSSANFSMNLIRDTLPLTLEAGTYTAKVDGLNRITASTDYVYFGKVGIGAFAYMNPNNNWQTTFTLTEKTSLYMQGVFASSTAYDNKDVTIQLEKGSTATTYEAYTAQEYEVNLGKNLFDKDNYGILSAYFGSSDSVIVTPGYTRNRVIYVPCQPSTTYSITLPDDDTVALTTRAVACSSQLPSSGVELTNPWRGVIANGYTTTADARYLCFYLQTANGVDIENYLADILDAIQLEQGSTATSYAPYFTPIELAGVGEIQPNGLPKYCDTIKQIDDKWYIEKQVGKVVLDGTEDGWGKSGVANTNNYYCTGVTDAANVPANNKGAISPTLQSFSISQMFATTSEYGVALYSNAPSQIRLCFPIDELSTLAQVTTWLSTHPTTVYYALATPTTTEITNQSLIDQLNALKQGGAEDGTTYIKVSATDPNLPAKLYVEAPKYD